MKLDSVVSVFDSGYLAEVAVKAIIADAEFWKRAKAAHGLAGTPNRPDPYESFQTAKKLAEELMKQFGVKSDFS